jgi:pyruvate formate lyase activating enzyme
VHLKALLPASLIEFPGHIADVLYVGECNFRCPYCYNVDLVLHPGQLPNMDPVDILRQLAGRRSFVDGVVISGGEATLQPGLVGFLREIGQLGFALKLDTNGYRPDVLAQCLREQVVQYVAMDLKSSLDGYELAAGVPLELERIRESVSLLLRSQVDHEFRTTVVPTLVEREDIRAIAELISGARRYYLQCFQPGPTVGWGSHPPVGAPPAETLREMADIAADYVEEVAIRGLQPTGAVAYAYPR